MVVYSIDAHLVKVRKKALGEPNRPGFHANLDAASPILALVDDDLRTAFRNLSGLIAHTSFSPVSDLPIR